jgi:peptide chain release factor 1
MGESGGRGRISQIVSRDVDSLDGGNGTLLGGGNTLLHSTHIDGESGLVTDGRGDTTQKGRHLGTGLGESENVVNEKQHILTLLISEVFSDCQTGKGNTGTGSRGLVHLTEDQGDLGLAVKLDDGSLLHFVVQIVTLTGTLTDTSEDGVTTVGLGDVVDKLLNEHSLADTGTTEETNLSTTGVGGEKIDDLDTSDEDLSRGGLLNELGGFGVDREALVSLDGTTLVNGVTSDVHDTAKSLGADGNGDGSTGILGGSTSDETLSTCEMELGCIFVKIRNDDDIPSMAMQRTTFSPRCC